MYMALLAGVIAVCAWICVPAPVPFTMQTFGIFLTLLLLGGRRGAGAVGVYLLLGAVGLPVFSNFQGGLGVLLGVTGGYIVGFLAQALVYWAVTAQAGESRPSQIGACAAGLLTCYGFGTVWFLWAYAAEVGPIGLGAALAKCVVPFILPDLCKLILAMALCQRLRPRLR